MQFFTRNGETGYKAVKSGIETVSGLEADPNAHGQVNKALKPERTVPKFETTEPFDKKATRLT